MLSSSGEYIPFKVGCASSMATLGSRRLASRLDVELTLEDERGSEGAHARLVAVHGGEVVVSCVFEELVGLLHGHGGFLLIEGVGLKGGEGKDYEQKGGNANYEQCCGKLIHNS